MQSRRCYPKGYAPQLLARKLKRGKAGVRSFATLDTCVRLAGRLPGFRLSFRSLGLFRLVGLAVTVCSVCGCRLLLRGGSYSLLRTPCEGALSGGSFTTEYSCGRVCRAMNPNRPWQTLPGLCFRSFALSPFSCRSGFAHGRRRSRCAVAISSTAIPSDLNIMHSSANARFGRDRNSPLICGAVIRPSSY